MHPAFGLTGRTALVTGAGSPTGIGFATARLLGHLGAHVVVCSTTERIEQRVGELRAEGLAADGLVADLTDEQQVAALPGEVDVLVNNAGMISVGTDFEAGRLSALSLATWRAGLRRNLDTAFLVSRHVVPGMAARGWGRVVNVASVTGPVMAMRDDPAYAAAKAGLVGLTRALAVDVAGGGVTVNAVAPGWIATGSQTDHERLQGLRTPMGRSASPEEVAAAIVWLCTPGASYTTGQCLVVDGGNSIAEERG
ncbi:MAG TPA: SDR family NAD(P)-dependent oxidoreductase [Actinomycetota bacterium]|nr:SDR family NAD(P)-dependent oxidoreductase [Actinomycetota bacterium]